jgi:hypothetical protein
MTSKQCQKVLPAPTKKATCFQVAFLRFLKTSYNKCLGTKARDVY